MLYCYNLGSSSIASRYFDSMVASKTSYNFGSSTLSKASHTKMSAVHEQQYWLPGFGLSRHIVLGHIQYFLGPHASARPFTYQGREGYLITGMPLTREQINDLAIMSREYERQEAARMTTHAGLDGSPSSRQSSEPYINEPIPVHQRPRRRPNRFDTRGAR